MKHAAVQHTRAKKPTTSEGLIKLLPSMLVKIQILMCVCVSQLRTRLRELCHSRLGLSWSHRVVFWEGDMMPVYAAADTVVVSADSTTMVSWGWHPPAYASCGFPAYTRVF